MLPTIYNSKFLKQHEIINTCRIPPPLLSHLHFSNIFLVNDICAVTKMK
jgi:hypothetical protein